jgi:DNA polymerase III epsilon subunit-like protein
MGPPSLTSRRQVASYLEALNAARWLNRSVLGGGDLSAPVPRDRVRAIVHKSLEKIMRSPSRDPSALDSTLVFIDLEASGLFNGYPTEIGWIRYPDRAEYSTLIRPDVDWLEYGIWDNRAEAITGITRDDLERQGRPRTAVAADLMRDLDGRQLFVDGKHHDVEWLHMIIEPESLSLQSFDELLAAAAHKSGWRDLAGAEAFELAIRDMKKNSLLRPHRALNDAKLMLMSFELAITGPPVKG